MHHSLTRIIASGLIQIVIVLPPIIIVSLLVGGHYALRPQTLVLAVIVTALLLATCVAL
jgi:hypothetical protein